MLAGRISFFDSVLWLPELAELWLLCFGAHIDYLGRAARLVGRADTRRSLWSLKLKSPMVRVLRERFLDSGAMNLITHINLPIAAVDNAIPGLNNTVGEPSLHSALDIPFKETGSLVSSSLRQAQLFPEKLAEIERRAHSFRLDCSLPLRAVRSCSRI